MTNANDTFWRQPKNTIIESIRPKKFFQCSIAAGMSSAKWLFTKTNSGYARSPKDWVGRGNTAVPDTTIVVGWHCLL